MDCLSHLFKISITKLSKKRYKRHQGKGWTDGNLGPFGRRPAPGGEGNRELSAGFAAQLDAALSGALQETEQKAIEMGAVRTLSKPVQGIELVDIINELVA